MIVNLKKIAAIGLMLVGALSQAAPLPADSLYQLGTPLTDQNGKTFHLSDLAGQPVTVSMFYGSCQYACPILLHGLKTTAAALPASVHQRLHIVLVSLDPQHDDADSLAMLAKEQQLDPNMFRLAVAASEPDTRALAGIMGIKYRRLPDGEINHTTRILLLDDAGRVVGERNRIEPQRDPGLLQAWKKALKP